MQATQTPFHSGWMAPEMKDRRVCRGTYCLYDYDTLPILNTSIFTGELAWLTPLSVSLQQQMHHFWLTSRERRRLLKNVARVCTQASATGLRLPPAFTRLLSSIELQQRIPSSTACYFDVPKMILPSPFDDGCYVLRFLKDQQSVLSWYVYGLPSGDHCVVVSSAPLDQWHWHPWYTLAGEMVTLEMVRELTYFCGPSFEEFLYRYWIENHVWFGMYYGYELTIEQRAYLAQLPAALGWHVQISDGAVRRTQNLM